MIKCGIKHAQDVKLQIDLVELVREVELILNRLSLWEGSLSPTLRTPCGMSFSTVLPATHLGPPSPAGLGGNR